MSGEPLARVEEIFRAAVSLNGAARDAYLEHACEGNAVLRRQVDRLLAADSNPTAAFDDEAMPAGALRRIEWLLDRVPPEDDASFPSIEGFTIRARVGEGGMGVVFDAQQAQPSRRVALKVLRAPTDHPDALRRFEFEAEILARLQHPGIAAVYAAGTVRYHGTRAPWIAMEFVPEARTITRYADEENLGVSSRASLLIQLGRAVHHAHQRGVIHRDLKPANILVDGEGRVRVIDFGVARVLGREGGDVHAQTATGAMLGTFVYMSPEQVAGDPAAIDVRTDVHALGLIAYELFTGVRAFAGEGRALLELLRDVQNTDPISPSSRKEGLDRDIDAIVLKALSKDRAMRYASAEEFAEDLERRGRGHPVLARSGSRTYVLMRKLRRHRWSLLAAAGILGAAAIIGLSHQRSVRLRREADSLAVLLAKDVIVRDPFQRELPDREALESAEHWALAELDSEPAAAAALEIIVGRGALRLEDPVWAEEVLRRALGRRESLGAPTADRAEARHQLARALWNQGRFDEAEANYEIVRAARMDLGPEHRLDYLDTINDIAACRRERGDLVGSEVLNRQALDGRLALLGEESPWVAASRNNLGVCLRDRGRIAEAESLFVQAVEYLRAHASSPIFLARGLRSLAECRILAGDYARAAEFIDESEVLRRSVDPAGAGEEVNAWLLRAKLALAVGDSDKAVAAGTKAQELGAGRAPVVADANLNLGWANLALGRIDVARDHLRQAQEARRSRRAPDHPDHAGEDVLSAEIARQRGDLERARQSLADAREHLAASDESHPLALRAALVEAELALDTRDGVTAPLAFERILGLALERLPESDPLVVRILLGLSESRRLSPGAS